jgi:hypothetical protein
VSFDTHRKTKPGISFSLVPSGTFPQALLLAAFDLMNTANRQAIAHDNAIRFRIAAWQSGGAVARCENLFSSVRLTIDFNQHQNV